MRLANINLKNPYSVFSFLFVITLIGYLVFSEIPLNVFSYDILGYYLYLPAKFKYHDLALTNFNQLTEVLNQYYTPDGFYQAFKLENGNWVMKYPMGMAILYSPFYFLGDLIAKYTSYPQDGFSLPYQLSVLYGCYFYTCIGLFFLRKVLLHLFSDKIVATLLLLITLGTNYLMQVSIHAQPAMVHNLLFSMHAVTIYLCIKWHQEYKLKYIILLGLTIGLTAIARPPEFLIVLFLLLYSVSDINSLLQKFSLMWKYRKQMLLLIIISSSIISAQLIYWKLITGNFIFDSYGNNLDEGFNWLHPYILEFLFSFRKGWLLFTPIMLFSLIGFVFLFRNKKSLFYAVLGYFLLNFYVMASWSCWWYGTSYSSRAIIPTYVVLSIPFGYLLGEIKTLKSKIFYLIIFLCLIILNLFQSWQAAHGVLHGSRMTKAYYKSVFLQTNAPTKEQDALLLMDKFSINTIYNNNPPNLNNYRLIYHNTENFDEKSNQEENIIDSLCTSHPFSFLTDPKHEFAANLRVKYSDISEKTYLLFKISAKTFSTFNFDSLETRLVINMQHKEKCYSFNFADTRNLNLKSNVWNTITYYYITPDFWDKDDLIQVYFWNVSGKPVFVDDITIEAYEPLIDESVF